MMQDGFSRIWRPAGAIFITSLIAMGALTPSSRAEIPPAERLLPADTFFVATAPDSAKVSALFQKMPLGQLWNDPAMKPFHDKFVAKWKEDFVLPLERDLGIKLDEFSALLQGQFTLAFTLEGWQGQEETSPAMLLLLDTKEKSGQLKTNLTELRKKWVDAGKPIKTEKIRDVEFAIVPLGTNDVPKTLRRFFPQRQEIQELGKPEKKPSDKTEIIIGQFESLLIAGNSLKAVEKVIARLTGGSAPALADDAAFEANRLAMFREAPLFAWFNAKVFFEALAHQPEEQPNPQAPSPVPTLPIRKLMTASGLAAMKTVAFDLRETSDGTYYEIFLGAPEASRQGLVKILSVETKDANPPPFVPADAVKFRRARIDGQKVVAAFEKMLTDLGFINSWNFVLNSGSDVIKLEDPAYDLRKDLVANLGDDLITYEKAPRGNTPAELESPPSITLIGSPNADKLLAALKGALVILSPQATKPQEREFLGRKIFSVNLTPMPLFGISTSRTLNYAASGGYVAFSTDAAMLEEYLRSNEGQPKALRETPGLAEAAQKVGGQATGLFAYENKGETTRVEFEALRKTVNAPTNSPANANPLTLASSIPYSGPEKSYREWMDYSLLPEFAKVAKYFHFSVYAANVTVDGVTFKFFSPTPPGLKN